MGFISEVTLLKSALASAVLGILLLILVINYYSPKEPQEAREVFLEEAGASVSISGVIKEVRTSPNLTQMVMVVEVPVIAFSNITLESGKTAIVQGKAADYQGKREIIASKITQLN